MGSFTNWTKTVIFLGLLTALMLWVGSLWGQQGLLFALIFVFIMNFASYFFSDKIVLAMYGAKPLPKTHWLSQLVHEVALKAKIPTPKAYIISNPSPNAFATGRSPKHSAVACTEGILHILNKDELRGVIAHEISHIKNRDTLIATIAATIAGVIGYIAMMARWGAMFGGGRDRQGGLLQLLVLAILTPIIATIIQLAISRSREFLADSTGAKTIHDSKSLASALKKIHAGIAHVPMRGGNKATASLFIDNPFRGEALMSLFSTHPDVTSRIKRLNEMKF
ncbi:zinc metalloprotease HtpX [Candidatus Woesearchaeota archaeon]|nr:zinc metalloprotease HtpX [Candidatus Woesearchaeota archaeon]